MPEGVIGAVAHSVTYAPEGTPWPGLIAVGYGLAPDETVQTRGVGIVWYSTDVGQTWEVISDSDFDQPGRGIVASEVAADSTHVVVGGHADVPGVEHTPGENAQTETILWTAATDGSWSVITDGASLRETRSSRLTALRARQGGGFVAVSEVYDTAAGTTLQGGDVIGDPSIQILVGSDPDSFHNVTDAVADIDQGAVVESVVEFGHVDVFFGMDTSGGGAAWTVDSSSIE